MTETLTRREANKARTREAVIAALRDLVVERPVDEITVDQLAEAAGISRRTFFNYYGSIGAVLVEVFSAHAEAMVGQIDQAGLVADPIAALREFVTHGHTDPDFLGWMAALNCHGTAGDAALAVERTVWTELGTWLDGRLHEMLSAGTDPLYVTTLATSVMHAFSAAEKAWLADRADPTRLSASDLAAFPEHLDRALGYLAAGWRPEHDG
ncbi:TetR/AcrR family transcriptional regulator [Ornithinimicrobium sp. Y1847]|uniref:TetR/AcrR family transcriptional regulator n=1 Tax=Ornithinimicrobium sp. Y1847 TaxID=3405419 RepID=UPI003B66D177